MYLLDKAFLRILEPYGLGNEPVTFQTVSSIRASKILEIIIVDLACFNFCFYLCLNAQMVLGMLSIGL